MKERDITSAVSWTICFY